MWQKAAISCSLVLREYIYFPLISNALVNFLSLSIARTCDLSLAACKGGKKREKLQNGHFGDCFTERVHQDDEEYRIRRWRFHKNRSGGMQQSAAESEHKTQHVADHKRVYLSPQWPVSWQLFPTVHINHRTCSTLPRNISVSLLHLFFFFFETLFLRASGGFWVCVLCTMYIFGHYSTVYIHSVTRFTGSF